MILHLRNDFAKAWQGSDPFQKVDELQGIVYRNFKGRQGSASGRTLLMSPAMVAAAAIAGKVCDVRQMINTTP